MENIAISECVKSKYLDVSNAALQQHTTNFTTFDNKVW